MPLRTPNSSASSGSQSPPSGPPSSNQSPASLSTPLVPISMARAPEDTDSQGSRSAHGTPNRTAADLPRSQSASKGGCWTCRLRRKKCDEQRNGDSCQTCIRLKIPCLGWGTKRPEWMRDKQAVEEWKAGIKSQLMRQGLIRGQPRSSLMQTSSPGSHSRVQPYRHTPPAVPSLLSHVDLETGFGYRYVDTAQNHLDGHGHNMRNPAIIPSISGNKFDTLPESYIGGSSSSFNRLSISSYNDVDINSHDISPPSFSFSSMIPSQSPSPETSMAGAGDSYFDYPPLVSQGHSLASGSLFDYDPRPQSPVQSFSALSGLNRGEFVVYYFNCVRKLQYIFAGNSVTNATYSLILQEPQGAVANAVCALACLHYKRRRVAEGVEAPDDNPDQSNAKLFHDEAVLQIAAGKQVRGHYTESDAFAALHLTSYSLFSGGLVDWRNTLAVAYEWLAQTGITLEENPSLAVLNFSLAGRCAIKTIMWFDIISSVTLMRAPKYQSLYRRLFGRTGAYWGVSQLSEDKSDLPTDFQSGCPDEVMIALGEVSLLAEWKASELCNGSLSVRELIRRGDDIEQQLRQYHSNCTADVDHVPLHPNLPQLSEPGHTTQFPTDDMRRLTANIFREAVILYLHTVLSDSNPAVPEISASLGAILQLMNQLPASEVDRSLVFPICIAGCLTDDPMHRNTLSGRLQSQDQSIGNLLQACAAMELVWQKRDGHGTAVDWRECLREHGRHLLLV